MVTTYNDIFINARHQLRTAGIDAADLEARLLAAAAAGKTKEQFIRDKGLPVAEEHVARAAALLLERRLSGEPIAYILGEWEFYGLPMTVCPGVLIPRDDTVVLAEAVISLLRKNQSASRVLDMCTGTGCVGLAIAAQVPTCQVLLADVSPVALQVSRDNTQRHSLTDRVSSLALDLLEAPPVGFQPVDVFVCNPPYIPTGDITGLDSSVRDFEPALALDGGGDGLLFYRRIAEAWRVVLENKGIVALECGFDQAAQVAALLAQNGFTDIAYHKDTQHVNRVVTAVLKK